MFQAVLHTFHTLRARGQQNFLFNCTFDKCLKCQQQRTDSLLPIACVSAPLWEANESEILLFNSFHIHYKKLMNCLRDCVVAFVTVESHTRADMWTDSVVGLLGWSVRWGHSHLNFGRGLLSKFFCSCHLTRHCQCRFFSWTFCF